MKEKFLPFSCSILHSFSSKVTDMMVANSHNLIITVKPANQRTTFSSLGPRRGSYSRNSNVSHGSHLSRSSIHSNSGRESPGGLVNANYSDSGDHDDEDEIRDLTSLTKSSFSSNPLENTGNGSTGSNGANNNKKPILHL